MIPQEFSLFEDLLQRLAAVQGVQMDSHADAPIHERLRANPDALYPRRNDTVEYVAKNFYGGTREGNGGCGRLTQSHQPIDRSVHRER